MLYLLLVFAQIEKYLLPRGFLSSYNNLPQESLDHGSCVTLHYINRAHRITWLYIMKRSCSIWSLLSLSILPSFIFNGVSVWRQTHTSLMLCTLEWAVSIPRAEQINTLDHCSWHDAREYPYYVFGHNDLFGLLTFCFPLIVWYSRVWSSRSSFICFSF